VYQSANKGICNNDTRWKFKINLINSSYVKISIILSNCVQSVILRKYFTETCNFSYIYRIASLSEILNCSVLLSFFAFTSSIRCAFLHFVYKLYTFSSKYYSYHRRRQPVSLLLEYAFCFEKDTTFINALCGEKCSVLVLIKAGGTGDNYCA
jgi:hypothetical protein